VKQRPCIEDNSPVNNILGGHSGEYTGGLDSLVVNTSDNLDFSVVNTPRSPTLGVLRKASEQVYKKISGDKKTRESRLPSVLITGES
jgi:hypothetical protein